MMKLNRYWNWNVKDRLLLFSLILFMGLAVFYPASQSQLHAEETWTNGLPSEPSYFPIGVWLQNPKNAPRYQAAGFNLYVGLWKGPTDEQLNTLLKYNMPVICHQNKFGLTHPANKIIVGWMHGDEPDNAQPVTDPNTGKKSYGPPVKPEKIVRDYKALHRTDPTRPVLLNLGQGVANDEWHGRGPGASLDDYKTYVKGCDIVSYDVYPVVGIRKPDGENYLWYVAKGVERLKGWTQNRKTIWNVIECTHISNEKAKASPHQIRAEVWMSIIHGSSGIIYFVHEFKPKFNEHALLDDAVTLEAVTVINKQIHELASVLNCPTVPNAVSVETPDSKAPVAVMMKQDGIAIYLFAVGMRNQPTEATFSIKDFPISTNIEVVGENRTRKVEQGTFSDTFQPYDVHIYKIRL